MAVLPEATLPEDNPVLAASTEVVASMAAAASTEAAAVEDSSNEVMENMKHKMMKTTTIPLAFLATLVIGVFPSLAQQPAQPTFPSAADATQSLFEAVQSNNEQAIASILGGPTELTSSRDEGQDKVERELFVQKYQEMHRVGRAADRSVTLYIGAENWPFPIPIVEKNGAWRFDPDAGTKEVMFRRIGENELTAIAICRESITAATHDRATVADLPDSV